MLNQSAYLTELDKIRLENDRLNRRIYEYISIISLLLEKLGGEIEISDADILNKENKVNISIKEENHSRIIKIENPSLAT